MHWKILFSILPLTIVINCYSQSRGVSIAEDSLPPDPSAIVDVRSVNKGVLIPRMTYEQMLSLGTVETPAGTTVYVTALPSEDWNQQQERGLYYWSGREWRKLEIKRIQYPPGAILFYSFEKMDDQDLLFDNDGRGQPGTKMDGWQICNGRYGSPDLRARFVVGADGDEVGTAPEYNILSQDKGYGGYNILHSETDNPTLKPDAIARHQHLVDFTYQNKIQVNHRHELKNIPHKHKFMGTIDNGGNSGVFNVGARNTFTYRRLKVTDDKEHYDDGEIDRHGQETIEKVLVEYKVDEGSIEIDNSKLKDVILPAGGTQPIDNRPPFYVGIFIMRTDGLLPQPTELEQTVKQTTEKGSKECTIK